MKSNSTAASSTVPDPSEGAGLPTLDQFRTMAELGGDVAFSIALPEGRLAYLSPSFAELSGHDAAALQGALDGIGPAALAPLGAWLTEVAYGAPGVRCTREFDLQHAEGRPLALEAIATVVVDSTSGTPGTPAALVGLLCDLSERRAYLAEQKRFASMLNHEFRTPLATIDGAIQRLEATSSQADDATRQRYRKIGAAVDRLIAMLDEYLSPDRMAALGRTRQPNTITVRDLVETGVQQVRAAHRQALLETEELPLMLRGEPEGLRLALKVLIDNALAFSPPGSPVTLRARRSGGGVELAVLDGGDGVAPEDAGRVFDKGYRGKNAAGMAGSGLGLYMARSIVEVHGGMLSLAAVPEQEQKQEKQRGGAEFRLWMPALGM
jgi:signal transduction histidine kinase